MGLDVNLKDELRKMDETFGDQMHKMYGPTLLTWPSGVDSARLYMFTSHLKQVLTILDPDVPRIQTGYEKVFGEYNRSYKELNNDWEVVNKIQKYKNGPIYTLTLYNKETNTYDMIEKIIAENLTEKFGYIYNTHKMDSLNIGDHIKNDVLYKSTSYDDHMNYRYGKNAMIYFSTSNDTLEDALVVRRSWAQHVKSVEVDAVQVPINDNDILLNLYGDDQTYKPLPDLGEKVKNSTLCATRRINKDHILYDFQAQNMREINSTDTDYYVSKDSMIYDIDVFYNGEDEFPSNLFYSQLKSFYDEGCEYAKAMLAESKRIKNSGSNYTENVSFYLSKYKHWNDNEYKWADKNKAFGNIIVEFKVRSEVSLEAGSKLSARYGNKGVISHFVNDVKEAVSNSIYDFIGKELSEEEKEKLSKNIQIVDDDKMPYTDDGPVDILLNASAVVRRLISEPMFEVELNFIGNEIRKKICTLDTIEEKENMIFKFLSMINEDEYQFFYKLYHGYDKDIELKGKVIHLMDPQSKENFIKDVEINGFYLIKPPDACIRYESIKKLYEEFPFIKPVPLYMDIFGTKKRRLIKDGIVGSMFMIVLKQNSRKNSSARSTFRVNRANLPAKDTAKKTNRAPYAKSPIRLSEIYNLLSSITGSTLTEYNMFMRSSPMARKSLDRIIATEGNPLAVKRLKLQNNFVNANAEILNARLKSIGLKIRFLTDSEETPDVLEDVIMPLYIHGYTIYDSPLNKPIYNTLFKLYDEYLELNSIIYTYEGQKQDLAWQYVFNLQEVKDMNIPDNIHDILLKTTKGIIDTNTVQDDNIDSTDEESEKEESDDE